MTAPASAWGELAREEGPAAWLSALLDASPDALLVYGPRGELLHRNALAESLLAQTTDEQGRPGLQALLSSTDIFDAGRFDANGPSVAMRRTLSKAGRPLTLELRIRRLERPAGPLAESGLLVVAARDVSAHTVLERQLQQNRRVETMGRLAGGIAHDFNNLLTSMMGNVELLRMRGHDLPELDEVQTAVDRATELTGQLLAFSRSQELEPQVMDLDQAIAESSRLVARLIGADVEVRVERTHGLWPVCADPGQVQQVLMNLVLNARDAMPEGGTLTLRTRNIVLDGDPAGGIPPGLAPGEYVLVTVEDTGEGMDAETMARLGEPFFTTKPPGKGTGLGLATVFGIVRQSGGDLAVDSVMGAGTRVRLWLPRTTRTGTTDENEAAPARPVRGSGTVLLLEDDELVRRFAARTLAEAGYEVIDHASPAAALEGWAQLSHRVRALVTDIVMPVMSGPAVAARLRESAPDLPVVYISGYVEGSVDDRGRLPEIEVLAKPFSAQALLERLAGALSITG
ncbi:MAG: response regulator [Deltaproteobacteria bacterium]|nr:response regulator [Deltaproteobacteria bacterium]